MKPSKYIIPGRLKYVKGDATVPDAGGMRYIVHVCNDVGGFGAGFVNSLKKRWPKVEQEYRAWYRAQTNFKLGEIQIIPVQSDTSVINMIAQHDIKPDENGNPPIRYDALTKCLDKVGLHIAKEGGSVHGPRFGAGLAGGTWEEVEKIIQNLLILRGINVTIYDLP